MTLKPKLWENGEEFVFDSIQKVPVVGALYAIPRTVAYGLSGNKHQSKYFTVGFVNNVKTTTGLGASLLIAPFRLSANAGGQVINSIMSKACPPLNVSKVPLNRPQ